MAKDSGDEVNGRPDCGTTAGVELVCCTVYVPVVI
jgi:hypothetical protein